MLGEPRNRFRDRGFRIWHIDAAHLGARASFAHHAACQLKRRISVRAALECQYLNHGRRHDRHPASAYREVASVLSLESLTVGYVGRSVGVSDSEQATSSGR
jgi:hypothetical protein